MWQCFLQSLKLDTRRKKKKKKNKNKQQESETNNMHKDKSPGCKQEVKISENALRAPDTVPAQKPQAIFTDFYKSRASSAAFLGSARCKASYLPVAAGGRDSHPCWGCAQKAGQEKMPEGKDLGSHAQTPRVRISSGQQHWWPRATEFWQLLALAGMSAAGWVVAAQILGLGFVRVMIRWPNLQLADPTFTLTRHSTPNSGCEG